MTAFSLKLSYMIFSYTTVTYMYMLQYYTVCPRKKGYRGIQWRSQTLRAVASLSLPGGQDRNISSILPHFPVGSLIFPQIFFISFLILVFRVGGSPTREGSGYATADSLSRVGKRETFLNFSSFFYYFLSFFHIFFLSLVLLRPYLKMCPQ